LQGTLRKFVYDINAVKDKKAQEVVRLKKLGKLGR